MYITFSETSNEKTGWLDLDPLARGGSMPLLSTLRLLVFVTP